MPAPRGRWATRPKKRSARTSRASTPRKIWRTKSRRTSCESRPTRGALKTKGGAFAKAARTSGRTRSSPRCAAPTARCAASRRSRAISPNAAPTRTRCASRRTGVFDSKGEIRGFAKVTRDITVRREAEETRRALLEQREARVVAEEEKRRAEASFRAAQEANRAKDEFLMTLSHELRTPMTAILGWSRLLPTLPVSDASFKDAIAAIGRSAQLQAKLIDDVLDISRIVSGKLRLAIDFIDVVPILRAAVDAVRPSADAQNISITTNFEPRIGSATVDPV